MKLYVALLESNVVTNRIDYEKLINEKAIKVNNKIVSDLEKKCIFMLLLMLKTKENLRWMI